MSDRRSQIAGTRRGPQAAPGRQPIYPSFHHSIIPSFHHSIVPCFDSSAVPSPARSRLEPGGFRAKQSQFRPAHARRGTDYAKQSQFPAAHRAKQSQFAGAERANQSQFAPGTMGAKSFSGKGLWLQAAIAPARKQSQWPPASREAGSRISPARAGRRVSHLHTQGVPSAGGTTSGPCKTKPICRELNRR